jgi:SAM-dependent methyltransferase
LPLTVGPGEHRLMLTSEMHAYYALLGERDRLRVPAHGRLEYLRTWDLLTRLLPPAPASVLDVGGATGVYAGPLAAAGYTVHVVDPLPEHAAAAAALPGVTAAVGDARRLPAAAATADAVLLLGPLYHLTQRADRVRAWREAARAVRPGGPVAAATIGRYASAFDGLARGFYRHDGYAEMVDATLASGEHRPPGGTSWFTTAYFHEPEEAAAEAREAGLAVERVAVIEGPLWIAGRLDEILDDEAETAHLLRVLRHVEADPALLAASSHVMTVARRAAST